MKTLSPDSASAVNTLYESGAFLFRVGPSNRPFESRGFFNRQLSLDALLEHLERGQRLGIEPSSINTVAVDIDHGDPSRLLSNFPPSALYESRTQGRAHAYYSHDGGRVSSQHFDAPLFGIKGDLKYARSYCVLYAPQRLAEDLSPNPPKEGVGLAS